MMRNSLAMWSPSKETYGQNKLSYKIFKFLKSIENKVLIYKLSIKYSNNL